MLLNILWVDITELVNRQKSWKVSYLNHDYSNCKYKLVNCGWHVGNALGLCVDISRCWCWCWWNVLRQRTAINCIISVKVIICIKINITLIPGITLDCMFIFRLVALIRTSTSFDNWQTAELIRKMSSVREWMLMLMLMLMTRGIDIGAIY